MAHTGKEQRDTPGRAPPFLKTYPAFLRKVDRARMWDLPPGDRNAETASQVFVEGDRSVSLWLVSNDTELRRVAIAMNENRNSPHERLDLLPIRPEELQAVGAVPQQTPGDTTCEVARRLHHDVDLNSKRRVHLCQILLGALRVLERCKKGQMKVAEEAAKAEGCPAAFSDTPAPPDPLNCDCQSEDH